MRLLFTYNKFINPSLFILSQIYAYIILKKYDAFSHFHESMFFFPDSHDYKQVALWYLGELEKQPYSLKSRPFGYPLFLLLLGLKPWLIFYVQNLLWVIQPVLLYNIIKNFMKIIPFYFLGLGLFLMNISGCLMVTYALTETFSTTLLLAWFLAMQEKKEYLSLFILAFLSCVKPVFFNIFLIQTIHHLFVNYKVLLQKSRILKLIFASSPILYQVGFMSYYFGIFHISIIGSDTIKNYLLSSYIMNTTNIQYETAKLIIDQYEPLLKSYIYKDILGLSYVFLKNIWNNIFTYAFPSIFPPRLEYGLFTVKFYKIYGFLLFILICLPFIFLNFFLHLKNLKIKKELFYMYLCVYWILFSSGITFWQADRILLPIYPFAVIALIYWLSILYKKLSKMLISI